MKLEIFIILTIALVKCSEFQNKTLTLSPFYFNIHSNEQSKINIPTSTFKQYKSVFNYNKIDGQDTVSKYCSFYHHNVEIESYNLQKINNQVDGNLISFFTFNKYVVAITDKYRVIQFAIDFNDEQNEQQNTNSTQPLYNLDTINNKITRIFENVIPQTLQEDLEGDIPLFGYSFDRTIHLFYKKKSFYMKISSFNIYEIKENYKQRQNIYRVLQLSNNEIIIACGKEGLDYYKISQLDNNQERFGFTHNNIQIAKSNDLRDIIFIKNNQNGKPIFAVVDYTKAIYITDSDFKILFSINDVPPQVNRITCASSSVLLAIGKDQDDVILILLNIETILTSENILLTFSKISINSIGIQLINIQKNNGVKYLFKRQFKGDDEAWNEVFTDKYMSFVLGKFRSRVFFHGINKAFLEEETTDNHNMNIMVDQNLYKNIKLAFSMPIQEDLLIFAITQDEILNLEIIQKPNYLQCQSEFEGKGHFQLQQFSTDCDLISEQNNGFQICTSILDVQFDVTKVYIDSNNIVSLIVMITFSVLFLIIVIILVVIYTIRKYKKKYQTLIEENQQISQKYQELENQSQYMTKYQNQEN